MIEVVIMDEYFCMAEPLRIIVASSSIIPRAWKSTQRPSRGRGKGGDYHNT
jgi:hypothetical protein